MTEMTRAFTFSGRGVKAYAALDGLLRARAVEPTLRCVLVWDGTDGSESFVVRIRPRERQSP